MGFCLVGGGFTTIDVFSSFTSPFGINNHGHIVGYGNNTSDPASETGFLAVGASVTYINRGGRPTIFSGINDGVEIVGYALGGGFLLTGGNFSPINTGLTGRPRGINNGGQIVGELLGLGQGFILSGDSLNSIEVPGALDTFALGINDPGQIVGCSTTGSESHGFLLSGGSFTTIDAPGGRGTCAYDINNGGQIVGHYWTDGDNRWHGLLATPVPLPSTLLLLGAGLAGLTVWRKIKC